MSSTSGDIYNIMRVGPTEIPKHLGKLYTLFLRIFRFLETNDIIKADRRKRNSSSELGGILDADIHGCLLDLTREAAPWIRLFPTVSAWDDAAGRMLVRRSTYNSAYEIAQNAEKTNLIPPSFSNEMKIASEASGRAGVFGEKSSARIVGNAKNIILAGAEVLANSIGTDSNNNSEQDLLSRKIISVISDSEKQFENLSTTFPGDLQQALRSIFDEGRRLYGSGAGRKVVKQNNSSNKADNLDHRVKELEIINHEMAHRMKNTLAMVQAVVTQTLRNADSLDDAGMSLGGRLLALAQAHDVLMQGSWSSAAMRGIIDSAVTLHSDGEVSRFVTSGPDIMLGPRPSLTLALILHELGTNATKYGALSRPDGHVAITWGIDGLEGAERFRLRWEEIGGPKVAKPTRVGFGSRLIERSLVHSFGGTAKLEFPETGVVLTLEAPTAPILVPGPQTS